MNTQELIEVVAKDSDISTEKAEAAILTFFTYLTADQISECFAEELNE